MARRSGWTVRCSDGTEIFVARREQALEFAQKHWQYLKRKGRPPWCVVQGGGGKWGTSRSYGCLCSHRSRRSR